MSLANKIFFYLGENVHFSIFIFQADCQMICCHYTKSEDIVKQLPQNFLKTDIFPVLWYIGKQLEMDFQASILKRVKKLEEKKLRKDSLKDIGGTV